MAVEDTNSDPCEPVLQTKKMIRQCLLSLYLEEKMQTMEDLEILRFMLRRTKEQKIAFRLWDRQRKLMELERELASISC